MFMSRKPPKGKSLAEVHPDLASQWHPTKNVDLTPFDVTKGSGKIEIKIPFMLDDFVI